MDTSQYINRLRDFNFDMVILTLPQSDSPGNEQRFFWGSEAATSPGSENTIGVKDKAIDELIELVISAPDPQRLLSCSATPVLPPRLRSESMQARSTWAFRRAQLTSPVCDT